jgi:ribosomal protein S12 methylthiotransferase
LIKNIGFISLGCPKNLVDSENMLGVLVDNGYIIVDDFENADAIIINTCGFIESAIQESINTVLEAVSYKDRNCKKIIVTGCLTERFKNEVIKEIPEIDSILGVGNLNEILEALNSENEIYITKDKKNYFKDINRFIDKTKTYAYVKIADGCDNNCSYCVIPKIRGVFQSRSFEDIINESKLIVENGIYEIILVAQDLTRYGLDLYKERKLVKLIKEISKIEKLKRIRLLYCYPDEIDENLIDEFKNNEKLTNYIDIPIQHINDNILKKMNRRSDRKRIESVLNEFRRKIPEIILRTSVITGFPGESEEEHRELCKFIKSFKFDRLGVFKYSEQDGTAAYSLESKISEEIKEKRYNELMKFQNEVSKELLNSKLNSVIQCVVEGVADDGIFYYGRSYGETPENDGLIYFTSERELKFNEYVDVKILNSCDYDLIGEVIK